MKKYLLIAFTGLLASLFIGQSIAQAASFNKNRLIDDSLFVDTDSMTIQEIQQFLDNEGGSLLADWVDNVDMRRPSDNCVVHHATGMTAAEIIYEAATAWNAQVYDNNGCAISGSYWGDPGYSNYTMATVSPKDLLVTLQKEQSLISADGTYSTNPNAYKDPTCCGSNEYKLARAMGYGVPDSGSINEKYLGFYNQINWAAWQLRFNFERAGGNTDWDDVGYIVYSGPMIEGTFRRCTSCSLEQFDGYYPIDGSPLYMENRATASLYYYTPHTYPGFFGNYNFVQFYTQWFGSPINPYSHKWRSQSPYPMTSKGSTVYGHISFENTGNNDWYDSYAEQNDLAPSNASFVRLSTSPIGTPSKFGNTWLNNKKIASVNFAAVYENDGVTLTTDQHRVEKGQVVKFGYKLTIPSNIDVGTYIQKFVPVIREGGKSPGPTPFTQLTIRKPLSQKLISKSGTHNVGQGKSSYGWIKVRNSGSSTWYDNYSKVNNTAPAKGNFVDLSSNPTSTPSIFGASWLNNRTIASQKFATVYEKDGKTLSPYQHRVETDQIVKFGYKIVAPGTISPSVYTQSFSVRSNSKVVPGPIVKENISITAKLSQAWRGQSSYPTLNKGDNTSAYIRFENTGSAVWYDSYASSNGAPVSANIIKLISSPLGEPSLFGYTWGNNRTIAKYNFSRVYENDGVTLAPNQHSVKPDQIVEFQYRITVPFNIDSGVFKQSLIISNQNNVPISGSNPFLQITIN